jgi:SAM-dependent methyltransferase
MGDAQPAGAFSRHDYENLAALEEQSFWFRARNELVEWVVRSRFAEARSLLDVGCGNGFVLSALEPAFPEIAMTGCELSADALAIAESRLTRTTLRRLDALELGFDGEFDLVCAFDVLEHIEDDEAALAAMGRAASPSGGILVTVPQHRWLWSAPDDYAGHKRRYTRDEMLAKLSRIGFEEVLVTSFVTTVLPAMYLSRLRSRSGEYDPVAEHLQAQRGARLLDALMRADLGLIRRGHSLKFGGSLLVAARRRAASRAP